MEAMASKTIPADRLLRPDDAGYEGARQVWNGMISHRPAVIARVESTEDVVAALALAGGVARYKSGSRLAQRRELARGFPSKAQRRPAALGSCAQFRRRFGEHVLEVGP